MEATFVKLVLACSRLLRPAGCTFHARRPASLGGSCSPAPGSAALLSSMSDFEFFKILLPGKYEEALRLPAKFVEVLGDRRDLKLQLAGGEMMPMPLWDVEVFEDEKHGDVYLRGGWTKFVRAHDLREGYMLVFSYNGRGDLVVTVFDRSTYRKQYLHAGAGGSRSTNHGAGAGRRSPAIAEPSHFVSCLRQCNLAMGQNQYLVSHLALLAQLRSQPNPPLASRVSRRTCPWSVEFQDAHGYARRRRVELQMGGRSWVVSLKRSDRPLGRGDRSMFKNGWYRFCVDNGLEVGDTCFFRVIREGSGSGDEDEEEEEWEQKDEDDEHVHKVEVRKKNGAFIS